MSNKSFQTIIISSIVVFFTIMGLTSCTSSHSAILLDGEERDPTKAKTIFTAEPGVKVTYQETKTAGGSWTKVKIDNTSVWIDSGYLQCKEPKTAGSSCKIK